MDTKRSDNLCNFYILPLIGLNKLSFGGVNNFINSYVSNDDKHIVVEMKEAKTNFQTHKNYVTDFVTDKVAVVFNIPQEFADTISKFRQGKYSHFTAQVKKIIKDRSGLKWKVVVAGPSREDGKKNTLTARELLIFGDEEDHQALRETLEDELGVRLPKDAELISVPDDNNFYNLAISTISN